MATIKEKKLQELYYARIRRVKRWLRPLPRRANVHRYPFLKRFAKTARKRSYMWSFRVKCSIPALYSGFILTFMPLYGVQIPLAFIFALIFKANLPILIALQLISNPITVPPIYIMDYYVGNFIILHMQDLLNISTPEQQFRFFGETGLFRKVFESTAEKLPETMLGGIIIGYIVGIISSIFYRFGAKYYRSLQEQMAQIREKHSSSKK